MMKYACPECPGQLETASDPAPGFPKCYGVGGSSHPAMTMVIAPPDVRIVDHRALTEKATSTEMQRAAYNALVEKATGGGDFTSIALELWTVDETAYAMCDNACDERGYVYIYGGRYCLLHAFTTLRELDTSNGGLTYQKHVAVDIARPASLGPKCGALTAGQVSQIKEAIDTALRTLESISDRGPSTAVTVAQWRSVMVAGSQLRNIACLLKGA